MEFAALRFTKRPMDAYRREDGCRVAGSPPTGCRSIHVWSSTGKCCQWLPPATRVVGTCFFSKDEGRNPSYSILFHSPRFHFLCSAKMRSKRLWMPKKVVDAEKKLLFKFVKPRKMLAWPREDKCPVVDRVLLRLLVWLLPTC